MSLILDALNRSRQDQDTVPGLATQHEAPSAPRRMKQLTPWFALAVAVLLIVWLLLDRNESPSGLAVRSSEQASPVADLSRNVTGALTSVKTELQAKAGEEVARRATSEPVVPTRLIAEATDVVSPTEKNSPAVEVAEQGSRPSQTQAQANTVRPAGSTADPAPKVGQASDDSTRSVDAVADLYRNRPDVGAVVSKQASAREKEMEESHSGEHEEPVDIARMMELARAEMGAPELAEHSAPFLAGLSQQTKDSIPTILYQQHEYSDGGGSSVTLNGNRLRQGASASGFRVQEILPNSVVLEYRGTVFRLRALNSWVNL